MTNARITAMTLIELLWKEGYFKDARIMREVVEYISEKFGHNFPTSDISKALTNADFLICTGKRGTYKYKQKVSPIGKKIESISDQLFSVDLLAKFGKTFKTDIEDLHINFGRSGNGTAFFLRKILEKAIYLAFAKNSISIKLEDGSGTGRLLGLEAMVDVASREKIGGVPFLLPKTAEKIKGIKFLGDTSAHNPLANVDVETILPQMPFIITAYKELAERLV